MNSLLFHWLTTSKESTKKPWMVTRDYLPVHYLNKPDCWGEDDRFQSVNRDEVHANENNLAIQQDFIKNIF